MTALLFCVINRFIQILLAHLHIDLLAHLIPLQIYGFVADLLFAARVNLIKKLTGGKYFVPLSLQNMLQPLNPLKGT